MPTSFNAAVASDCVVNQVIRVLRQSTAMPFSADGVVFHQCTFEIAPDARSPVSVSAGDVWPVPTLPAQLHGAVPKRQAEFLAGRVCAMQALQRLIGRTDGVPIREDRGPAWPQGVVGSISHSRDRAAAVVAHEVDYLALGIDIESRISAQVAADIHSLVLEPDELRWTGGMDSADFVTLALSAKESMYKAIHPLTGVVLDFTGARIAGLGPDNLIMELVSPVPLPAGIDHRFQVRYRFDDGHVLTWIGIRNGAVNPAPGAASRRH